MSTTPENFNALAGNIIEQVVLDLYEWERDNTSWHDARCESRDAYIEIKGCRVWYPNGRRGRFQLYRNQHEKLVEHDGYYAFAVYVTEDLMGDNEVERIRCVPAEDLEDVVTWNRGARKHRGGKEYQLGWTKVFDVDEKARA